MILALAGGVGGARLASGLARALPAGQLTVAVNVGDDFEHLGLAISPDLDTVMYTLAGLHNPEAGWGRAGETWNFMETLTRLGGESWFRLGDHDLAVHVERTRRLGEGEPLSAVTAALCGRLGIAHEVVPVSDDPLRTIVLTDTVELGFQDYFVRRRCEPVVRGFRYEGASQAGLSAPLARRLVAGTLEGVVLCPSNPWLSVAPMLAIPALRTFIESKQIPVVAVSPIVGGAALKGPAAKIMRELGLEPSALAVARHYGALVDGWLVDTQDAALAAPIAADGHAVEVADTVMASSERCREVAARALALLRRLARSS
jgi:LPPG:FO 2-phospho-L-lactate transferase